MVLSMHLIRRSVFTHTRLLLLLLLATPERTRLVLVAAFHAASPGATSDRVRRVLVRGVRIRLVRRLERRIHAGLEAQERKVSAPGPGKDREERKHDGSLHVVDALAVGRIVRLAPRVGQVAEADKVQERPQRGEAEIPEDVVFPGFDGGHLLEQVLAGDEGHRGQERDHADSDGVVAGVRVPVDDAVLLAVFFPPAFGRYAREHDYREEPTNCPQDHSWPHHEPDRVEGTACFASAVGSSAEVHHFRYVLRFEAVY